MWWELSKLVGTIVRRPTFIAGDEQGDECQKDLIAEVHRPTTWAFFYAAKDGKIKHASSSLSSYFFTWNSFFFCFQNCYKIQNYLKARIHYEIFLSEYFMKNSLMRISLHLIWLHETHIKHVNRKSPRTIKRKN